MKKTNASINRNHFKSFYFESEILAGEFDFPLLKSSVLETGEFFPFNIFMSLKDKNVGVHFFIDDYQFERVWSNPKQYIEALKKAKIVLSPDFSMYLNMPKALQIYNCYRSRALARFLQKNEVKIVPVVCWSDKESFSWCFDGINKGSVVAVSSNGCIQNRIAKEKFLQGYKEMRRRISPTQIYFVGTVPDELKNDNKIIAIKSHGQTFAELKGR